MSNVCKFCGQVRLDDSRCNCREAEAEARRESYLERAREEIDKLLGEDVESGTIGRIKEIAEHVSYGELSSAKFVTASGINVVLKKVTDGAIRIDRSESIKSSSSVSELG